MDGLGTELPQRHTFVWILLIAAVVFAVPVVRTAVRTTGTAKTTAAMSRIQTKVWRCGSSVPSPSMFRKHREGKTGGAGQPPGPRSPHHLSIPDEEHPMSMSRLEAVLATIDAQALSLIHI